MLIDHSVWQQKLICVCVCLHACTYWQPLNKWYIKGSSKLGNIGNELRFLVIPDHRITLFSDSVPYRSSFADLNNDNWLLSVTGCSSSPCLNRSHCASQSNVYQSRYTNYADWLVVNYITKIVIGSYRSDFIIFDFNKISNFDIINWTNKFPDAVISNQSNC
jgi:hypothetical protein